MDKIARNAVKEYDMRDVDTKVRGRRPCQNCDARQFRGMPASPEPLSLALTLTVETIGTGGRSVQCSDANDPIWH